MNPNEEPKEKLEILHETVASTDQPFGYETDREKALPEPEAPLPEPVGLAMLSAITALLFPIVTAILWSTIRVDVDASQAEGFGGYALGTILLFLVLIFVVPITTIFSAVTAYVSFRRSRKTGRYIAAGSGLITLVGIVLLILLIGTLQ